jgi:hypothetical protein
VAVRAEAEMVEGKLAVDAWEAVEMALGELEASLEEAATVVGQ